ncbi:hypothetical protein CS542_08675 [Pedobacter sp. IW39]|nr:hypothetical protein CS542_08675 [Pedobacter sp. IW39]
MPVADSLFMRLSVILPGKLNQAGIWSLKLTGLSILIWNGCMRANSQTVEMKVPVIQYLCHIRRRWLN